MILVAYTTASTRLTGMPRIPQILASTASEGDIPAAKDEISTLLRESHHISGDGNDDFTVPNQTDLATAAESSTCVMTLLMAAALNPIEALRYERSRLAGRVRSHRWLQP